MIYSCYDWRTRRFRSWWPAEYFIARTLDFGRFYANFLGVLPFLGHPDMALGSLAPVAFCRDSRAMMSCTLTRSLYSRLLDIKVNTFELGPLLQALELSMIKGLQQDCIPVGCIPPACWPYLPTCTALRRGVSAPGGAWSRGGGCLLWGGRVPGPRGVVSQHALRQTPLLWTEFLTHATENITLSQTSLAGGNKWLLTLVHDTSAMRHYSHTNARASIKSGDKT